MPQVTLQLSYLGAPALWQVVFDLIEEHLRDQREVHLRDMREVYLLLAKSSSIWERSKVFLQSLLAQTWHRNKVILYFLQNSKWRSSAYYSGTAKNMFYSQQLLGRLIYLYEVNYIYILYSFAPKKEWKRCQISPPSTATVIQPWKPRRSSAKLLYWS